MLGVYQSKLKKAQLGTFDEKIGIPGTTDRGLYRSEIEAMLAAPFSTLGSSPTPHQVEKAERDQLILYLLWETWARISELLAVRVEDLDMENRTIHLRETKRKIRSTQGEGITSRREERITSFSQGTRTKIIKYLQGRSKGQLFLGNSGGTLWDRAVRKMVMKYAEKLGIQKVIGFTREKTPRFLIVPKAFREAGEAYAIMEGMDRDMAAKRAGHSQRVQGANYAKYDGIRARDLADRHRLKV